MFAKCLRAVSVIAENMVKAALAYFSPSAIRAAETPYANPQVTQVSPTLGRAYRNVGHNADVQLQLKELASQFKADAMAIDPTIKVGWICHDMTLPDRDEGLAYVLFEREESEFVKRGRKVGDSLDARCACGGRSSNQGKRGKGNGGACGGRCR